MRFLPSLMMTVPTAAPMLPLIPQNLLILLILHRLHGSSIDITTDKFSVRFKQFAVSKDYGGNSCLMIYYDYTNSGDSQSSAFVDFTLQASQNGESLEGTYPEANDTAVDNYMNTIDPGKTVTVCQVFLLKDTTSDVTLQGKETLNVSGGQTTSQVLKLQ